MSVDWYLKEADAEQAKSTGGMLALFPRSDYAEQLVIPGGEPVEDLHLTMLYFGEDVTGMSPDSVFQAVGGIADQFSAITARILGHAQFNASGPDPCAVYLVSDSVDLRDLHYQLEHEVGQVWDLSEQHVPWIPHITAGYSTDPGQLGYEGDIIFDRLGIHWAGESHDFPLA